MKPHTRLALAALFAGAMIPAALAQTRTFTNQYTFGDSLSDNGNVFAATGGTTNASPPYFGGRFSNGRTFAEQLGNTLAVGATAPASVKTSMGFAFGGAAAAPAAAVDPVPTFAAQIQMFQSHGVSIQRTDLFTVWVGNNDVLNTAPQAPANPSLMDRAGAAGAQAAIAGIQTLIGLGAKNLLVVNLPDIGLTPRGLSTGAGALLTRGSLAYNAEFDARLAPVAAAATDVTITRIDAAALIAQIQRDYVKLGYANASSGLAQDLAAGRAGDPNGYVFFDGIHPSARTHTLLANVVLEALNPEPVVGFAGTLGSAALALQGLGAAALDDRTSQLAVTPRGTGRADAYASFNYGDGDRGREGWRPKFKHTAQVVTAGADLRLSDGVLVGAALNAGRLSATVAGGGGDFKVEDAGVRVYGVWRGGPVSLTIDGDYGTVDVKGIHRATAFGGLATSGKTAGDRWGAGLKAAWAVEAGAMAVRPWLGLRTHRVSLDGYTERDIATLTMEFASQDAKSSSGALGVDATCQTKLGGRQLRFDLRGAWHGEIGSRNRTVSGRLANNFTRPTLVSLEDGDGDGFELGGAATLFLGKTWSASLGCRADVRSGDKVATRASLSVQTGF
ncbi:MAG: autotransporter domain-containing protein [Verrucomicrobia bacterium]|nr:autotransporter domain-containing protein [Verrucomicrobiota bacterium]